MNEMQVKEIEKMLNELLAIGRSPGYLSLAAGGMFNDRMRNIRAIEIGGKLNEIGGMDAMRMCGMAVSRFLDATKGRELEVCWDGIGNWHG
jgi:hypothetical protein